MTAKTEAETREIGAKLVGRLRSGDVVLFSGELGAGKTTMIRGMLRELGYDGPVRSPTFNLIQVFPTDPPVAHADLYRVSSHSGVGLEDYLETHVCLIEWPDRARGLIAAEECWLVDIVFDGDGRNVTITEPSSR